MDVVVKSRHCTVSDSFRSYVEDKITRLEKLDDRVIRVEVELSAERNKRQHAQGSRVEITVRTKGPVIRAEAAAEEKVAAFDLAPVSASATTTDTVPAVAMSSAPIVARIFVLVMYVV